MALDPMSRAMKMKNVAGFHSLDFGPFASSTRRRSAIETRSSGRRNAFGMIAFQTEDDAIRGTVACVELDALWSTEEATRLCATLVLE